MKRLSLIILLIVGVYCSAQAQAPIFKLKGPYNVTSTTPVTLNTNGDPLDGRYAFHFVGNTSGVDFNGATLNIQGSLDGTTFDNLGESVSVALDITDNAFFISDVIGYIQVTSSGTCDVDVYFAEITTDTK